MTHGHSRPERSTVVASRGVHFVIMGCGRVGSTLAKSLSKQGHDVAIIDAEPAAFRRLGSSFEGMTVTGIGFDRDTLKAARIDEAYAFAAVSSGDNSNILSARVARETFGVEHVAARIYDPGRAMVYQRLGIPTVATVRWTSDQMLQLLLPQGSIPALTDPSGRVVVAQVPLARSWVGRRLTEVESVTGSRIAFITRLGDGLIPGPDTVFQDGDQVHVVAAIDDLGRIEKVYDQPPPAH
jgi:trk system potassium uptake protein